MILETMMEAAKTLFPHLHVHGIRRAQFLHPVECSLGKGVTCEISCLCAKFNAEEVVCEASMSSSGISPAGLSGKKPIPYSRASILLGGTLPSQIEQLGGFPIGREELDCRTIDSEQVKTIYRKGTNLKGRYRVIQGIDGISADAIRGQMTYVESKDFSTFSGACYQYSPYLLEGLLHILNLHTVLRYESEPRSMIPCGIGEMIFTRKCAGGESFILEARLQEQTELGCFWDARALDESGASVMQARRIEMRWC